MQAGFSIRASVSAMSLLIQGIFLMLLYFLFVYSGADEPFLWAAMAYLMLSYGLRYFVPLQHRKGIRQLKEGNYEAAQESFHKSYVFFTRFKWLDTFRALTVFTVSKMSFKELALLNRAQALISLNRVGEANELIEVCLKLYPKNSIAKHLVANTGT